MKISMLATVMTSAMLFAGCLSAPFQPPTGLVTVQKAPLSTDGNWKTGTKKGESSSMSILGLVAVGDCSVDAAAKAGGLEKIHYADYGYKNFFGIYQSATVIVYGE